MISGRLSLLLGLVLATTGRACSCGPATVTEQAAEAAVVFQALVVGCVDRGAPPRGGDPGRDARYYLRVERTYQGTLPHHVVLATPRTGTSCDMQLTTLRRYVVFADRGPGEGLSTAACRGTQAVNRWVLEDLARLPAAPDGMPGRPAAP